MTYSPEIHQPVIRGYRTQLRLDRALARLARTRAGDWEAAAQALAAYVGDDIVDREIRRIGRAETGGGDPR